MFDPHSYIDWEVKVGVEFDNHDLTEHQMIFAASSALTKYALTTWKHICRHNNIPQTWKDFKMFFRDEYVPEYYDDCLLAKLDNLKQCSRTVKQYYRTFNICVMFGGLDECMDKVMSRFKKGFNSEIQTMLVVKSYNNIVSLLWLSMSAEKEILLSVNTCKNDEAHNVENLTAINAILE
jgi:hypothetical protein